ncbi:ethanolamine utilization protein EutN [Enterococcus sp. PF1-24]|uniref:EutN/CcmL family microcompartment protein n=1 Tax=unclassified Enterococcus TaxID=2608891 RepID=UPI002476039A|nr:MULTISPECIES: EutN/CcmL family microcompartment protein [unclassified Enterococcus]MDH6363320.1 ethanolamine utilization protein EutN [Enterococcus sp. PFB1-1]MDH6400379.1 ethanolamine utilization protein EutN [Enterococcus sp. PF1-24]
MLLGRVTGSLWATRKDEKLNGLKFMLVEVWNTTANQPEGNLVAADNAGAGIGDLVLVVQGKAARISAENLDVPIDAMIVGVVDSLEKNDDV